MKLSELISAIKPVRIIGPTDLEISGISYDSRRLKPGNLFVAIPGFVHDGSKFIPDAVNKGAVAVVLEHDSEIPYSGTRIFVDNCREALARLSSKFYDFPSQHLKMVGITGTNGKTTTSYFLENIFKEAGFKTGLIGTIGTKINGAFVHTLLTTPESLELQRILHDMLRAGVQYTVMEVSSHALALERVKGIDFDVAVHTNITHDHLDFHKTMDNYLESKLKLFSHPTFGVVNLDDAYADAVLKSCRGQVITYALKKPAQVRAKEIREVYPKQYFKLVTPRGEFKVGTPFLGEYNVYNILAAAAAAEVLGISLTDIQRGLQSLTNIPGRLERIECGQDFEVLVDFAHTPDGLKKLLLSFRPVAQGRLILVFGCTGSRDRLKRPIMGEIAARFSDFAFVTSDDPHDENPSQIIADVEIGMKKAGGVEGKTYQKIEDRKTAIAASLEMAKKNDILLIAGRGHETAQEIKGRLIHLDDREVVRTVLKSENLTHASF